MFWLTERILPAASASSRSLIASSSDSASGFCARIALMCFCFSAWRISAGCWSGGKARSTISTCGSSISASGVSWTFAMPQRSATFAALALVREAMATTGKPASL